MIHYGAAIEVATPGPDDRLLYSVTSILNVIGESDGLVWWARRGVAEVAIDTQSQWRPHVDAGDRKAAVDFLANAHNRQNDEDKDRGSKLHDLLLQWTLDGARPACDDPALAAYLDHFDRWLDDYQPEFEAAELTVYHPGYGYAGTLDAIAVVDGLRCVVDWKTKERAFDARGKPATPFAAQAVLQINAYARCELAAAFRARRHEPRFSPRLYALSPDEQARAVELPHVDAGLLVMLTPEHCTAYPCRLGQDIFRSFLHAIEVYRWVKHVSASTMGPPLLPPGGDRADHRPATTAA